MDTLIPAALVLMITTIFFAVDSLYWRRQAKQSAHDALQMGLTLSRANQATWDAAWAECRRHTMGLLHQIATRADREGRDAFAVLREVSERAEDDSFVQVPIEA